MSKTALETLGKFLMTKVRDRTLQEFKDIFSGELQEEHAEEIRDTISWATEGQLNAINELVRETVDATVHNLLWALEEERSIQLAVTDGEQSVNAVSASRGLAAEIFGDKGWIAQHSEFEIERNKVKDVVPSASLGQQTFTIIEMVKNEQGLRVKGRCGDVEIRLGDHISLIQKTPIYSNPTLEALPCDMVVDGIFAYGRSLDGLSCGMSAQLQLVTPNEKDPDFVLQAVGKKGAGPRSSVPYQQRYKQKELGPN